MPEVMIVACFIFLLFNTATGQPQSDMMRCSGPTNIHYHCGSNDFVDENRRSEERFSNSQQGRPGKSGVRGFKGEKGLKGEPGTNEDILRELQNLRSQVSALSQKIDRQSFARTCAEVSESRRESGIYVISPDSERVPPFSVFCNFSGERAETVVEHDSTNEIAIEKCEPARCYKRKIRYPQTLHQIVALIRASSECKQFIKLRCMGVEPHLSRNQSYATWISRDGTAMRNWGGSDQEGYCACGITGTCSRKNDVCNCDLGGTAQRVDEGFLTDGNSLPVTELQFGDNGDRSESGWHTLGPLICSGSS